MFPALLLPILNAVAPSVIDLVAGGKAPTAKKIFKDAFGASSFDSAVDTASTLLKQAEAGDSEADGILREGLIEVQRTAQVEAEQAGLTRRASIDLMKAEINSGDKFISRARPANNWAICIESIAIVFIGCAGMLHQMFWGGNQVVGAGEEAVITFSLTTYAQFVDIIKWIIMAQCAVAGVWHVGRTKEKTAHIKTPPSLAERLTDTILPPKKEAK